MYGTSQSDISPSLLSETKSSPSGKKKKIIFRFHVTITVHCQISENYRHHVPSLSCCFFPQKLRQTKHSVAKMKCQHCWKRSSSVNLVLCVNSGLGTGFRSEYDYSENTQKSVLTAAPLFQVNSECV